MQRREEQWRDGYHTTKAGEEIWLEDMTYDHLENTIRLFDKQGLWDTKPLRKERARRIKLGIK